MQAVAYKGAADPDVLWYGIIFGHCQSKANSRRLVVHRATRKPMFIKNKKALDFEKDFINQVRGNAPFVPIEHDVELKCEIYYPSNRNDLDESLVMDCLQKAGIIKNDRQIKRKIISGFVDKEQPRVEIELRRI